MQSKWRPLEAPAVQASMDKQELGARNEALGFLQADVAYMVLSLLSWTPFLYLGAGLLALLIYSTGSVIHVSQEKWSVPKNLNWNPPTSADSFADRGPSESVSHLCLWAGVYCFLGASLMFFCTLILLQAGGMFFLDFFSLKASAFLLFFSTIVFCASAPCTVSAKIVHSEYVALSLLSILGMVLLCSVQDLTSLYVCLELQSFALVVLCSLNYNSAYAVEAGMKYFLLSAYSSCLLLLGIGLIYWDTGITNFGSLYSYYAVMCPNLSVSSLLGLWFVSLALLWKLAAAPLHFWAADVYMGTWTSVGFLISTLPKISVLCFWVHHWQSLWVLAFGNSLFWFSFASLLVGALAPFAQVSYKRLLAFSSVGHMGFMLMCLGSNTQGASSLFVYLFFYLFTSLVVWALLMWPYSRQNTLNGGPQYLWDLSGLNQALPTASVAWAIGMLSLAGLPPAAGFLGKLQVFWSTLSSNMYALVLFALLGTLLSSIYYLNVLKICYVETPNTMGVYKTLDSSTAYFISFGVFILVVGLWYASPIVLAAHVLCLSL